MRPSIRTCALAALASISAAAITASGAWAQAAPPPGDGHGPRGETRGEMQAQRAAHEAQRAQDLKTILRLRPDQEPALTAFLSSHPRPDHPPGGPDRGPDRVRGDRRGPPPEPLTTAQRLDREARRETEMAAMRQKHADALRTFYAALNPEQKQVFDALQRVEHRGGARGPGGFGHPGFGPPGFGGPPGDFGRGDE